MNNANRLEHLERAMAPDEDPLVVVVDHPKRGPTDPVERKAWLQSLVAAGGRNVMIVRVIYDDRPRPGRHDWEEDENE